MDKILVTIIAGLLVGFIVWWFFGKHVTKEVAADVTGNEQDVSVIVNGGYTPSTVVLKRGIPAQITFNRKDPSSCLEQVVFEDFGINDFFCHRIRIMQSTLIQVNLVNTAMPVE